MNTGSVNAVDYLTIDRVVNITVSVKWNKSRLISCALMLGYKLIAISMPAEIMMLPAVRLITRMALAERNTFLACVAINE